MSQPKVTLHQQKMIAGIAARVKEKFTGEGTGHDWWHIERVRKLALHIGRKEGADLFIVELAVLLHDVADHKLHGGDIEAGVALIEWWLEQEVVPLPIATEVRHIATNVSYRGAEVADSELSLEGQVVRDADRLDAIGAVGIARTFAYGGNKNRLLYDPEVQPVMHIDFESYKSTNSPTLNHFYEKLLLLKDRMHTPTARKLAESRHQYMEQFIRQFLDEWEGIR